MKFEVLCHVDVTRVFEVEAETAERAEALVDETEEEQPGESVEMTDEYDDYFLVAQVREVKK